MARKKTPVGPSYLSYLSETISDRLEYCLELMDDYGSIVKVPTYKRSYLINDAEMIKYVLKDNPENYLKQGLGFKSLRRCLGEGLLLQQGEEWKRRRKHFAPVFQPKHIIQYSNNIQSITSKYINVLKNKHSNRNESFNINPIIQSIVYEIALDVFCGQTINDHELKPILNAINFEHHYSSSLHNLLPLLPTPSYWRYKKARRLLQTHIDQLLATAKKQPPSQTLIHKILNASHKDGSPLSRQDQFDELKTFLMTGHETSETAITWAMKLLAEFPETQLMVKEELSRVLQGKKPTYEDIENLPFTKSVFEEAMRLYPPVWMTSRVCQQDDYIGDYFISKGSTILISPYTIHRRECYWEKPDEFMPERHLPTYANKPPAFAFIPFMGGPRICIAHHFATMECVLIIAMLMQQFELSLDDDYIIDLEHIISLKPRNGVYVKISHE